MYLTLQELKEHLNIEPDFKDDDQYILTLAQTAEDAFERHTDRKLTDILVNGDLPASARHCMKLMVGQWFANREGTVFASNNKIDYAIDYLIALNRKYSVG